MLHLRRPDTNSQLWKTRHIYDKLKRPVSFDTALRTRLNGQLCALNRDVLLHELGVTKNWEWLMIYDLEEAGTVEDRSSKIIGY